MPKSDQQNNKKTAGLEQENTAVLTIDQARDAILALISTTTVTDNIAITDATGRTIAFDVYATTAIPPFKNSAMDGFCLLYTSPSPRD